MLTSQVKTICSQYVRDTNSVKLAVRFSRVFHREYTTEFVVTSVPTLLCVVCVCVVWVCGVCVCVCGVVWVGGS